MTHAAVTAAAPTIEGFIPPLCSVFRRFLKSKGLKFTPERAVILDLVTGFDGVFEADDLQKGLRESGLTIGMATVYRTLRHLVDSGILSEVLLDSKQNHYRVSYGRPPTGFLVCIESGQVIEFDAPELTEIRDRICKANNLSPVSSRLVVYASPNQPAANPNPKPGRKPPAPRSAGKLVQKKAKARTNRRGN